MIWSAIGNKWFDKWVKQFMNFHVELDSCACMDSPLTKHEVNRLRAAMEELNEINQDIRKRLNGSKS